MNIYSTHFYTLQFAFYKFCKMLYTRLKSNLFLRSQDWKNVVKVREVLQVLYCRYDTMLCLHLCETVLHNQLN